MADMGSQIFLKNLAADRLEIYVEGKHLDASTEVRGRKYGNSSCRCRGNPERPQKFPIGAPNSLKKYCGCWGRVTLSAGHSCQDPIGTWSATTRAPGVYVKFTSDAKAQAGVVTTEPEGATDRRTVTRPCRTGAPFGRASGETRG